MEKTAQKRSKKLILIFSIVIAVVAVVGIALTFLLNYNTQVPKAPQILDDGQNIFLSAEINDNYNGYRFKFVDEIGQEILIDSESNQISTQEMFKNQVLLGRTYKISTCYLAENSGNNSEFSDTITWKCQVYLQMPTLQFNQETSILSWNIIERADYYRIYISGQNDYIQTTQNFYDLQALEGGERVIDVVAFSNKENFLPSCKSNTISLTLIHYIKPFTSVEFDSQTKILTAKSESEYKKVNIHLGQNKIESNLFTVTKQGNEYVYKIDLTTIYTNQTTIGITPCDIDQYNIYNGTITYYTLPNA